MLKVFCVYFDRRPVWKSDCVEPIQAGKARSGVDLGMLADDTGDHISGETVWIDRILYGRRDYLAILFGNELTDENE